VNSKWLLPPDWCPYGEKSLNNTGDFVGFTKTEKGFSLGLILEELWPRGRPITERNSSGERRGSE